MGDVICVQATLKSSHLSTFERLFCSVQLIKCCHSIVVEMEALKYAPSWGLRHRRDSVSGLSVHSQPFGYGGMASPAPTYHSQGKENYFNFLS